MIVLGIDLGLTGAVAAIAPQQTMVDDLPTMLLDDDKVIDVRELRGILRLMVRADETALVVIEDVRVRQMGDRPMSHSNEGSLMRSRGHVEALVQLLGWRIEAVQPSTWKREFGLLRKKGLDAVPGAKGEDPKNAARLKACELFPGLADELQRVKDHNRAEALLIARYGQMRFA